MTRRIRSIAWAVLLLGTAGAAGCGKKAPPLAPLVIRPAAPDDVQVVRVADTVHISFKVPDKNGDGKSPARLSTVEVYGLTGEAKDVDGNTLTARLLLEEATKVGAVEIEPPAPQAPRDEKTPGPADPAAPASAPPPPTPDDPRPAQGEVTSISETVTAAVLARYVPTGTSKRKPSVRIPQWWDDLPLPLVSTIEEPLGRIYVVLGRDLKGRPGALSARVSVTLEHTPPTPAAPALRHTETAIVVTWDIPPGARRPVFEPVVPVVTPAAGPATTAAAPAASATAPVATNEPTATGAGAPADPPPAAPVVVETVAVMLRPLVPGPTPHTFNLYAVPGPNSPVPASAPPPAAPVAAASAVTPGTPLVPVNPAPLSLSTFEDPAMTFGVERCYVLRTVEARANGRVEGLSSPVACITPIDTFPPAAPRSLAAVGSEGAVNLIWEPNTEADFGGYIVLRGLAGSAELTALTPTPIKETTFRDAQVTRGQRYVYAIVAVDTTTPQNVSVESNRVEETAR